MKSKILVLVIVALGVLQASLAQKRAGSTSSKPTAITTPAAPKPALVSAREQATIDEINLARANPTAYIKFLEQFKKLYRGKSIHYSDGSELVTIEGVAALDEAIAFMRLLKPLPPLELRAGMVLAAKDHVNDLVKTGKSGHKGSDGSSPGDRMSRYGDWADTLGEDIVYFSRNAREDVIALIIDDGVSTRGHRKNIFQPAFHVIGIGLGPAQNTGTLCIITFAGDFKDRDAGNQKTKTPSATKY
jgi:uncharacterized protein YkwD